jgi:hypothetical protein
MALWSGIYPDLSATELTEAVRAKSDQRRLLWRFIGFIALIVATVGMATEVARWTSWR